MYNVEILKYKTFARVKQKLYKCIERSQNFSYTYMYMHTRTVVNCIAYVPLEATTRLFGMCTL